MYYALIKEQTVLGVGQCYCTSDGCICIEITEEQYNLVSEKGNNYFIYQDGVLVVNPNYEQEEAQKERERLDMLYLTAADVERAIYEDKGMDFDDVLALVEQQGAGIDVKRIKIEFKANNFYRGNQYVVAIGSLLGYTPEQLDYLFENGHF